MPRLSQIPNPRAPIPSVKSDGTVTYKTPKLKLLLLIAVSALFIAAGIWVGMERYDIAHYLMAGFCSLCALSLVAFCVQLHPRASYLTLKKNGFVFCSLFRSHEVRWDDVEFFDVMKIGGTKMVVWNYVPEFSEQIRSRRAAAALTGCEAALPDTYGFKAEDLAELMNQMKQLERLESGAMMF